MVEGISTATLPVVLYAGIIVTGIGYFSYMKAIEQAGPSNASIAFFIKPVIAVLLAAVILKEQITWNIILGVVLILAGSVINLAAEEKERDSSEFRICELSDFGRRTAVCLPAAVGSF